jgi:hypothetical protein
MPLAAPVTTATEAGDSAAGRSIVMNSVLFVIGSVWRSGQRRRQMTGCQRQIFLPYLPHHSAQDGDFHTASERIKRRESALRDGGKRRRLSGFAPISVIPDWAKRGESRGEDSAK